MWSVDRSLDFQKKNWSTEFSLSDVRWIEKLGILNLLRRRGIGAVQ